MHFRRIHFLCYKSAKCNGQRLSWTRVGFPASDAERLIGHGELGASEARSLWVICLFHTHSVSRLRERSQPSPAIPRHSLVPAGGRAFANQLIGGWVVVSYRDGQLATPGFPSVPVSVLDPVSASPSAAQGRTG